jgi:hypothetical protein
METSRRWMLARVAAVLLAVSAAAGIATASASADVVQGWGGPTHIWVGTGGKNYGNHTQWVSYITVSSGGYCPTTMEAWTAGFYASALRCGPAYVTWYIDRWVPSGNGVCGSSTAGKYGRQIACITIRV